MTVFGAFGCALIAFGPLAVLLLLFVANDSLQTILFTLSSFFWLLGLLAAAVVWFAVVPLRDEMAFSLAFGCLLQELMRFLLYLLISKAEHGLQRLVHSATQEESQSSHNADGDVTVRGPNSTVTPVPIFNLRKLSLTAGLGFAVMGGIVEYAYIFRDVFGPGTIFRGLNPGYFFIIAGLDSCFMGLLQISWSVILFRAYRLRACVEILAVYILHVAVSAMTLLNERPCPVPELVCLAMALATIGCFVYAFFAAGGRLPRRGVSPHPDNADISALTPALG